MKHLRQTTIVVLAMALIVIAGASTASATTLETNGVTQTSAVTFEGSLTKGTSVSLKDTSGAFLNTCVTSKLEGATTTAFTGTRVSGPLSTLQFGLCTHEVVVHKPGSLSIESIKGTTNGTVLSTDMEVTSRVTIFGFVVTATCTTSETDLGTFTGAGAGGTAEIDVNAVINCGEVVPSSRWEGTYLMTVPNTPTGAKHAIGVLG